MNKTRQLSISSHKRYHDPVLVGFASKYEQEQLEPTLELFLALTPSSTKQTLYSEFPWRYHK